MDVLQIYELIYYFMLAVCIAIFISGLDDAFVDVIYWLRTIYRAAYRRSFIPRSLRRPINVHELRQKPQNPIAIMVPAWDESNVIASMLTTTVEFFDYDNYQIFVGAYRNDVQTMNEVKRMARRFPNVQLVVVPHDGPTNKADCLNWIIQAVFLYEEENKQKFAGIVMHDSEDVVHPLELRLYNWLLDRVGLIQIPVRTLEPVWHQFVAGTYLDEFAEWHCKDLIVREVLGNIVPSAGVATCFSREAIEFLVRENRNQPFNTASLTEDYDISFRLSKAGVKQIFVNYPVDFEFTQRNFKGDLIQVTRRIPIAVSEFFPDKFWPAVRQKSRWVIGIALQGWTNLAWEGNLFRKYFFLRDRKGLVVHFVSLMAYFLVIVYFLIWFGTEFLGGPLFPYALPTWLLLANSVLLLNRLLQRMIFVAYLYSWRQALLAIPRVIVCNFINFFATVRAVSRYSASLLRGKPLTWEKTDHQYPNMDQLAQKRKYLGELLLEQQAIDNELLDRALAINQATGRSLGRILVEGDCIDEEALADAICRQTGYPRAHLATEAITLPPDYFPQALMSQYRVFPLTIDHLGKLRLAVTGPLLPAAQAEIKKNSELALSPVIVTDGEMRQLLGRSGVSVEDHIELVEEKLCATRFTTNDPVN
jgi:adsorption protein B